MNIFRLGKWYLSSGRESAFKIELDELSPDDWEALASMGRKLVAPCQRVVSCGGAADKFAAAMSKVVTIPGTTLIVDDVLTSGKTMWLAYENITHDTKVEGLVVFARGKLPDWVQAIFKLDPNLWGQ